MLNKLLNVRKLAPFLRHAPSKPAQAQERQEEGHGPSSALKLVHVGGKMEFYYMAIPAARIMEKYPSFVLARPEIFRRPWDAVVSPEEMLIPGEKFYVVPLRTVRKLRKRNKKPNKNNGDISITSSSFVSQSDDVSAEMVDVNGDSKKGSSIFKTAGSKRSGHKHVRFTGVDDANKPEGKKGIHVEDKTGKKMNNSDRSHERKKKVHNHVTWEPKLAIISESYE